MFNWAALIYSHNNLILLDSIFFLFCIHRPHEFVHQNHNSCRSNVHVVVFFFAMCQKYTPNNKANKSRPQFPPIIYLFHRFNCPLRAIRRKLLATKTINSKNNTNKMKSKPNQTRALIHKKIAPYIDKPSSVNERKKNQNVAHFYWKTFRFDARNFFGVLTF